MEMGNVINVIDNFIVLNVNMNLFLMNAATKRKYADVILPKNINVINAYMEFIVLQNLMYLNHMQPIFLFLIQKKNIK